MAGIGLGHLVGKESMIQLSWSGVGASPVETERVQNCMIVFERLINPERVVIVREADLSEFVR